MNSMPIANFIRDYRVTVKISDLTAAQIDRQIKTIGMEDGSHYRVTLTRPRDGQRPATLTIPFSMGSGLGSARPTAYDVLTCLAADATALDYDGDMNAWAADLGYDLADSPAQLREAKRTFAACVTIGNRLTDWLPEGIEPSDLEDDGSTPTHD